MNNGLLGLPGGASAGAPFAFGLPCGTLQRAYTFDSNTVEGWTTDAGTLTASNGRLSLVSSAANCTMLEPSSAPDVADGEIWYVLEPTNVSGSTEWGIVFRATDANNHYTVTFPRVGATNMQFYKKQSGSYNTIFTGLVHPNFFGSSRVHILVRFVGSKIWIYADGTLIMAISDTTFTTGRAGIRAFNGDTVLIDRLKVYSLPSTWTAPVP